MLAVFLLLLNDEVGRGFTKEPRVGRTNGIFSKKSKEKFDSWEERKRKFISNLIHFSPSFRINSLTLNPQSSFPTKYKTTNVTGFLLLLSTFNNIVVVVVVVSRDSSV